VRWNLIGAHNVDNALAALAAARHAGVPIERGIDALRRFQGVARRMQLRGEAAGVKVYDDFAHHPTAIATTLDGLRRSVGVATHRGGARAALADHAPGRAPGGTPGRSARR
jgi:UDP-N-acetylmuramate: L-alanyl-gamma-D-glutamyl-meso-diaminopimelate ligase